MILSAWRYVRVLVVTSTKKYMNDFYIYSIAILRRNQFHNDINILSRSNIPIQRPSWL